MKDRWDRQRSEQLRASLTQAEIEALSRRATSDPRSLTLDEVGVLFLIARDRIRELERLARGGGGKE